MSGGSADVKGREEKRRKTEAQNLTFQSPGRGLQSVAEPTLLETGVRTMRSGRRIEQASAEQIEREDVFTEREGSLAERVLDLARQLKSQVMGEEDGGGSEHEDKSESGLTALAAKIVDAVGSLEQQLEDEQNSTPRSVALLGQNGEGKSFLINLLLQVTQATEAEYGLNGVTAGGAAKDTNDIRLRTYLFHTLEGSLELRKCADQFSVTEKDIVDNIKIQEKHGLAANHMYMPKEERDKEEIILRKIKDARLGTAPNGDEKCGFMLPSAGGGESTTKIAIKARRGKIYHLVIRYKTEEEIRAELAGYDWDQLEELDLDDDNSEVANAKYKLGMLLAVAGLEDADPEGVEKPKSIGEVQICDAVREKLAARYEIVAGRGRKLLDDRLYVRARLWELMRDQTVPYLLQECVVYMPADVLEGVELIDAPGTGVVSPQEQRALQDVLETADAVVVCMQRNLEDCRFIKPAIERCLQFHRYIENPKASQCPVFFFSAVDEQRNFTPLDEPSSLSRFEESKETIKKKNKVGIKQMVNRAMKEMRNDDEEDKLKDTQKQVVLDACLPGLEANIFSSYPLLWASVAMGPGGKEKEGGQISRAQKEEALSDVTRMLSSIRGRSAAQRQVMGAFFDKVKSVEPSKAIHWEPGAGLTKEMIDRSRQEARRRASRAFQHEVSDIARKFEMKLDELLNPWLEPFVDEILTDFAKTMVENVEWKAVVKIVHDKIDKMSTGSWRTLQTAFAFEFKGSYRTLDLFKCFFSKFALPCHSILEAIIEKLRNKVVELVQNFMIDEIVTTLATHANEGSSRRSGGGVSEDVKKLVKNAVLLTVSDSSQTLILDEALGVLKRLFKSGHKSLKTQLYESQVKSLRDNLLSKSSAGDRTPDPKNKDRRKQGGKDLNVMYKDIVFQNADSVIVGARDDFVQQVGKMVEKTLKEMKSRLVQGKSSGRSKPKGLPVLLKLRRECFKCIHEANAESASEGDNRLPLLLEEFSSKWQKYWSDDAQADSAEMDDYSSRLVGTIYLRHLLINLEECEGLAPKCKQKQGKVGRSEAQLVPFRQIREAIKKMKTGPASVDLDLHYHAFTDQLKRWKLEIWHPSVPTKDSNSLFWTLNQFLSKQRLVPDDGGGGAEAATEADVSAKKLRQAIVGIVERKHTTEDQCGQFKNCYGKSVQDWAREMRKEEQHGDEVCIEYFARHFKLNFRVYSPVLENPLEFPTYLEMGVSLNATSVFRIAHLPCEPGSKEVRREYYVPVWPAAVKLPPDTPTGTPLWDQQEFEMDCESWVGPESEKVIPTKGESWIEPVTGQERVRQVIEHSTQKSIDGSRAKRENDRQTGRLSVIDDTNMTDAVMQVREKQMKQKQNGIMNSSNFKEYWQGGSSTTHTWMDGTPRMYCSHKKSGVTCWFHEWESVCNNTHETIKIPEDIPR